MYVNLPLATILQIKLYFRFHPNNVLGIRQFADQLGCLSLVEAADKYLQQYFYDVSMSEEYAQLTLLQHLDIVKRDELHVISEEQVIILKKIIIYLVFL